MSSKKKVKKPEKALTESTPNHSETDPLVDFAQRGQAAQAEVDALLNALGPEASMNRFIALVNSEASKLNKTHRAYFLEQGINPFREAMKDLFRIHDAFDSLAGQKGISTK